MQKCWASARKFVFTVHLGQSVAEIAGDSQANLLRNLYTWEFSSAETAWMLFKMESLKLLRFFHYPSKLEMGHVSPSRQGLALVMFVQCHKWWLWSLDIFYYLYNGINNNQNLNNNKAQPDWSFLLNILSYPWAYSMQEYCIFQCYISKGKKRGTGQKLGA